MIASVAAISLSAKGVVTSCTFYATKLGISDTIIGLDRNYALEMIQAGDVSVEYDRLIDRQLERAAITSISGFAKLYDDAAYILNV